MRGWLAGILVVGASIAPAAGMAHDYTTAGACTQTVSESAPANDCLRIDTDTEFEDGLIVTLDGDDSDPRGDDISDGYVAVEITSDGATVYCEDEGGFNHVPDRDGGDEDDHNGENEVCEP